MIKLAAFLITLFVSAVHAEAWHFDVYLDKTNIGQHHFDLNGNTLTSQATFDVKILFINAYHYDHFAQEQWSGNCLTHLNAKTDDNGEPITVKGQQDKQAFSVSVNQDNKRIINQNCVMTFAYWNPAILEQKKLLNPQNAEYLDTDIQFIKNETITVRKQPLMAKHYRILGFAEGKKKLNIDVWYNTKNEWVQLKSTTNNGKVLTYKLI